MNRLEEHGEHLIALGCSQIPAAFLDPAAVPHEPAGSLQAAGGYPMGLTP
jgi:hypothetical protein